MGALRAERGCCEELCALQQKLQPHSSQVSLYIFPKTPQESLKHALFRSLCPFIYLHLHSVPFLCACCHQSYLQILGYNLLTVVSLQIVKYFMVSSFCEHWCNYQWWTFPHATLDSWVTETCMKWAKADRHSKCILKLVAFCRFSVHFYSLVFLLKTPNRGCSGCCCISMHCWFWEPGAVHIHLVQAGYLWGWLWPYTVTKSQGTGAYPQFNRKSCICGYSSGQVLGWTEEMFSSEDPGGD